MKHTKQVESFPTGYGGLYYTAACGCGWKLDTHFSANTYARDEWYDHLLAEAVLVLEQGLC
jgi:nitric oxide synthase oxygenase domain/subunit